MSKIQILDCTLRDGGYINDWEFGYLAIKKIISQLTAARIDIIECGFLEDCEYDMNCSIFNSVEQIREVLPSNRGDSLYVAMTCYGEFSIEKLSDYDGSSVEGIRVSFHNHEFAEAMELCKQIKEKGYKVFVQPVGTTSYSDEQLLDMINKVNEITPYSFYLVDTLGLMHPDDVRRMFYLINHNLDSKINMGFHSHNNLQLSYSNCQTISEIFTSRTISLDSSVYGMGRGAGNLNTEIIANYLNMRNNNGYSIEPILEIVDEFILHIKEKHDWGYSVPYYLAAINGCHPNYAAFLTKKQTLSVNNISKILRTLESSEKHIFNKSLIENKYLEFQAQEIDDAKSLELLKDSIQGKNILIIAPGSSIIKYNNVILNIAKNNSCVIISVSFVPDFIDCDYAFLSNSKRYETTFNPSHKKINLIYTSNIKNSISNAVVVNYSSLLNEEEYITDNSALMLLNLLIKLNAAKVYLSGLDGYADNKQYYFTERLNIDNNNNNVDILNSKIAEKIKSLESQIDIEFITPSLYEKRS